ncbi:MAG TPA: methyltransferase domain-containing protein [Kribbellaceae bacterium]|nr:methyltransferase domain-containing protein [Kribbellaceae bacterium]
MTQTTQVDARELEQRVKEVYRAVAERPQETYHFEMGRGLAERLGYPAALLDRVPAEALESFAGVGYFLDLAAPVAGDRVLDLGSGSGTDTFAVAALIGGHGRVTGVDMTDAQLAKAEALRAVAGFDQVEFVRGYIEEPPLADASCTLVISNGVVNLSADKAAVFREAARVLAPGGRVALADIVADRPLTEAITCNAELWAACVGGAAQIDEYQDLIEKAGLRVETVRENTAYAFLSGSAQSATATYGIRSISLLATKPAA